MHMGKVRLEPMPVGVCIFITHISTEYSGLIIRILGVA